MIDDKSEAIEFRRRAFDGGILLRGLFYFRTDLLAAGTIVPNRKEFHAWADKFFRVKKLYLLRSRTLDAYVGECAAEWRLAGARFASSMNRMRGPIYATD
jgi:hypothetical protein